MMKPEPKPKTKKDKEGRPFLACRGSGAYGGKCFAPFAKGRLVGAKAREKLCAACADTSELDESLRGAPLESAEPSKKVICDNNSMKITAVKGMGEADLFKSMGKPHLEMHDGEMIYEMRVYNVNLPGGKATIKFLSKRNRNGKIVLNVVCDSDDPEVRSAISLPYPTELDEPYYDQIVRMFEKTARDARIADEVMVNHP